MQRYKFMLILPNFKAQQQQMQTQTVNNSSIKRKFEDDSEQVIHVVELKMYQFLTIFLGSLLKQNGYTFLKTKNVKQ